jgi:hypothetical protein
MQPHKPKRHSTLLGIVTPAPVLITPFAGKGPQPGAPMELGATERQIAKSRLILDFVTAPAESRKNHENYLRVLVGEAGRVAQEIAAKTPAPEPKPRPKTSTEVLHAALFNLGLTAKISEPTWVQPPRQEKTFIFTIEFRGRTFRVSVRDSILESEDPVAEVEKVIRQHDLHQLNEAESESQKLYAALGIEESELTRRNIFYDGVDMDGNLRFVYHTEGAETIFRVPADVTGNGLADRLEEMVLTRHIETAEKSPPDAETAKSPPVPIPTSVLEAHAERIEPERYPGDMDEETMKIALVLDYLMRISPRPAAELVPEQYRAAFATLQEQPKFRMVTTTQAQMKEVWEAVDETDHPGLARIRQDYDARPQTEGPLDTKAFELFVAQRLGGASPDLCEDAMHNLALAYGMLTGNHFYESAPHDVLVENHALFMLTIRTEIPKLFEQKYLFLKE